MKKQDLVLVKWNEDRIKTLPVFSKYISHKKEISDDIKKHNMEVQEVNRTVNSFLRDNTTSKVKGNTIYLTAGINCIPKKYWEECKKHRVIQLDLKLGRLEEIVEKQIETEEVNGKKKKIEIVKNAFSDMSPDKKEAILEDTVDIRTLNQFKKEESSPDVRVMIQEKIKEVKEAKTDKNIGHPNSHLKVS
jgi:hypothetical protein